MSASAVSTQQTAGGQAVAAPAQHCAEIYPGPSKPLPSEFVASVKSLEKLLGMPIWLLVQNGEGSHSNIDFRVFRGFRKHKAQIEESKSIALLLDSPGGDAHFAYHIARLFQRRTRSFVVIIPQYAKSAATLLALGASELLFGRDAELGPLDAQIFDPEREGFDSALNAVQSLERLNAFSLTAIDQAMRLLMTRTGKKSDTLLPLVLKYATDFARPLLDKIDTLDYTKRSRDLKIAEQYAIRLMRPNYSQTDAERIAAHLVEKYPAHEFVIDAQESEVCQSLGATEWFGLGLKTMASINGIQEEIDRLTPFLDKFTALGMIKEIKQPDSEDDREAEKREK
jgi:hypothetical protein